VSQVLHVVAELGLLQLCRPAGGHGLEPICSSWRQLDRAVCGAPTGTAGETLTTVGNVKDGAGGDAGETSDYETLPDVSHLVTAFFAFLAARLTSTMASLT
jgi:hypothetical protein